MQGIGKHGDQGMKITKKERKFSLHDTAAYGGMDPGSLSLLTKTMTTCLMEWTAYAQWSTVSRATAYTESGSGWKQWCVFGRRCEDGSALGFA